MKIMKNSFARLSVACAFCAVLATPSLALDTDALLQRLEENLNAKNISLLGGNVTTEGNNVIVENFGIEMPNLEGADNLTLRLNDIVEGSDGSFTIGRLFVDDASIEVTGDRLDFSGFEVEQFYLPAPDQSLYIHAFLPYKSMRVKNFVLYSEGDVGLQGSNAYIEAVDFEAEKRIKYQGGVERFSFELADLGGGGAQSMQDIGYDTISGRVDFSGGTDFETGLFDMDKLALTFDNIGTLSLNLQFSGYTPDVAQAMAELSARADNSQEAALAMLGLAQQLSFNSFSVRFEDNSITNKILDYAAENMGSSREDMINMATAGVQFGLARFLPADLTTKASQALGSYLNAPQSIELVAAPAQPLPMIVLAGAAQDPKALVEMLGVEIFANKAR